MLLTRISADVDGMTAELPQPQLPWAFALAGPDESLFASGLGQRLTPGPAATLGARARDFFANTATDGTRPALLVGALPFDRTADDFLYQPAHASTSPWVISNTPGRIADRWQVRPSPSVDHYKAAVSSALEAISASENDAETLSKLVLSRSLVLEADRQIDLPALWARLNVDPSALRFLTYIGTGRHGEQRHLIGATPELLLRKRGRQITSHPLAGSAPRGSDTASDRAAADMLAGSAKDQREHRWVVEAIMDALAPHCRSLSATAEPEIVATQTMWHLGTAIKGELARPEETSAAELAALLHPTPAVGGTPRDKATALIHELEGYDRGFYAGTVGWTDHQGDGAWYVSLRCAEVSGNSARAYAGAGIVEGSTPDSEAAETSAKLQAILRALAIDEIGHSSN